MQPDPISTVNFVLWSLNAAYGPLIWVLLGGALVVAVPAFAKAVASLLP